ncbi:diaminobutyrate--2-oxoglutarate transaminase [Pararhizobium haloflavum]|uniref:diaminobutyrate--2-oxoglutarate transaminase n=1 Tax=Pararhizobium haloflavum TaxID=2037914 RepID=UPI000C1798D7|nr:diaminobutyrate--2-oxoglutarate transaminase [Pararhizobium haloflavum]
MTTVTMKQPTIFERRESESRSYCRSFPNVFSSAQNATLTDESGKTYIDFLAGCSSLNYGHNDPDMKAALIDYISKDGVTHGLDMFTEAKADFLSAFESIILKPRGMDYKVQFVGPTGANAVESAMKLARKVTGRTNIIAFTNGFHGVTMGALAATGNGYHRGGASAPLANVQRAPFDAYHGDGIDTAAMLEKMLDDPSSGIDSPAAILLETVQGEGGLNAASAPWVKRVEEIARAHGALLIIDDIQAGCGRTGTFFSFEEMGVSPDIVTMAKSFSGFGLPFSAVLIKPEHDIWGPAEHNGTFRGNNHAFVTARVALEKFWTDDAFQKEVQAKGDYLKDRLDAIASMVPGSRLKGRGMMRGIDVGTGELASDICKWCFQNGLIIETSGAHDEVVKILAPLTIEKEKLASGLDILEAAVSEIVAPNKIAAE